MAARIFQDLVKQAPQNAEAHRGLGEAYLSNGDYLSARHEFQRALRLNPNNQESMQALSLTNEVIDMDAALPYITGFEQVRRSRNLLSRVIKNIEECNPGSGTAAQRLQNARDLLTKQVKGEDPAYTMQTAAAQVWADRTTLCGSTVPQDRALDTVLTRIGHE